MFSLDLCTRDACIHNVAYSSCFKHFSIYACVCVDEQCIFILVLCGFGIAMDCTAENPPSNYGSITFLFAKNTLSLIPHECEQGRTGERMIEKRVASRRRERVCKMDNLSFRCNRRIFCRFVFYYMLFVPKIHILLALACFFA